MKKDGSMTNSFDTNSLPEAKASRPELKAGMLAKYRGSVGLIKEIFRSETSENVLILFTFPENIFKFQSLGNIVLLEPEDMWQVEPATVEELREYIRLQKDRYFKGLDDFFREVRHESS